jgi:hypothetical protein
MSKNSSKASFVPLLVALIALWQHALDCIGPPSASRTGSFSRGGASFGTPRRPHIAQQRTHGR